MQLENNLKKFKDIPETFKQILGLVSLTITIIIVFAILNIFSSVDDKSSKKDLSAENYEKVFESFPKGRLNFFEGSEGYKLSASEYKSVCSNTKIVTQRSVMGTLITDHKAHKLYTDNGNLIGKYFVKWDDTKNKCFAGYILKPLQGSTETITVSGEAKGFLKTDFDTRVYFIKNF